MGKPLAGMYAALMTGLDGAGEFDPERQDRLTRYVMRQGLHGLYVGGSSGESGLLESAPLLEQQARVATCARGGGAVLIAHVGLPSLAASIRLARNAERCGYDALSALPPHAYPFSDREIFSYYRELGAATALPLIVYEIPARVGRPLPLDLLNAILGLPKIAGVKFSSNDLFKLSVLRRCWPNHRFFFGSDEIFAAAAAMGVDGGIGTTYNLFGKLFVALATAMQRHDLDRARALQAIARDFVEILYETGVLPGMKAALRFVGVDCGPTRAPMTTGSEAGLERLRAFLGHADVRPWLVTARHDGQPV